MVVGALHFAPSNDHTYNLIQYLNTTTATFNSLTYHVHDDEDTAVNYILNNPNERTFALIIINSFELNDIDYTLRLNYSTLPNTNKVVDDTVIGFSNTYQKYLISGYLTLMNTIDDWAFQYARPNSIHNNGFKKFNGTCSKPYPAMIPFPTAAYDLNAFYGRVGFLLGLAMTSEVHIDNRVVTFTSISYIVLLFLLSSNILYLKLSYIYIYI